ncbi:MAG TPA: M48 family metallopeptidase [Candidatus Binatia bacterium]|jgi:STE24 endopeptidase
MEQRIAALFVVLFTLEFIVEFVLNELNLRYVRARWAGKNIPDYFEGKIGSEDHEKSVLYTLAKGRFERWNETYGKALTLIVLFSGLLDYLDRLTSALAARYSLEWYGHGVLFCLAIGLVFSIANLPVGLYSTFGLESKFGFNKTTIGLYIADKVKGLVIGLLIGIPFLLVVLWLMDVMGRYWWIWVFGFIVVFELVMIVIFPTLIAPWFNKFEPLKQGELRDRILALARQIGFKTSGIYAMDGSKRSSHSNAYFTGIGKSKRIVLFDTLIDHMTIDQGLAVLAHEMGHYKLNHIRRMLVIQTVFLFIGLYLLSLLVNYRPLFSAFGLAPSNHAALVLFSLLSGPATFYLGPLMNFISRKHEYEADRFAALTLHDGKPMEEALINLTVKNLSNLTPHPWYSAYHYSHPTPVERVNAIRQHTVSEARNSP